MVYVCVYRECVSLLMEKETVRVLSGYYDFHIPTIYTLLWTFSEANGVQSFVQCLQRLARRGHPMRRGVMRPGGGHSSKRGRLVRVQSH